MADFLKEKWGKCKRWIGWFLLGGVALAAPLAFNLGSSIERVTAPDPTPVISKLDRFEVSFSEKLPAEGLKKAEMLKDRPKVVLSKWNDEVRMGVEYKKITANARKLVSSNEVKWGVGNEVVHAYKKDDENFEIEIELKTKPATNVFDFTITGAENLDFFYQPALTPEEIAEGASRPENVIGSYAVYHKTKANHRVGSTNYATGKAFHIYRPKAIDANGVEVWAELLYLNGILSVTVPQKFLDEAVYPVRVDPTFGYTSLGASGGTALAQNTNDTSNRMGEDYVTSEAGTLDLITIGLKTANADDPMTGQSVMVFLNDKDSAGANSHGEIARIEKTDLSVAAAAHWEEFTAAGEAFGADTLILGAVGDGEKPPTANDILNVANDSGVPSHNFFATNSTGTGSYATQKTNPWNDAPAASTIRK